MITSHPKPQSGWESRNADYKKIHGDDSAAFDALLSHVNISSNQTIADLACGYGAVSKNILEKCQISGTRPNLILVDAYQTQLNRSVAYLAQFENEKQPLTRILSELQKLPLPANSINTAILKFGLHEIKEEEQTNVLREIYKTLVPKGELYIWSPGGKTSYSNRFFNEIVCAKDLIAGFATMAAHRHFPYYPELRGKIKLGGFEVERAPIYVGPFTYITSNLIDSDFASDHNKLNIWNEFIRGRITPQLNDETNFQTNGDSISLTFESRIVKATKK